MPSASSSEAFVPAPTLAHGSGRRNVVRFGISVAQAGTRLVQGQSDPGPGQTLVDLPIAPNARRAGRNVRPVSRGRAPLPARVSGTSIPSRRIGAEQRLAHPLGRFMPHVLCPRRVGTQVLSSGAKSGRGSRNSRQQPNLVAMLPDRSFRLRCRATVRRMEMLSPGRHYLRSGAV